ncbi:MAG: glycosyltransferase family 2 protein [Solobacterium sp.]|nr:glycosyltransferase family 2 protein [Solobacterium sp.]
MKPKVSVIVPCYNSAKTVEKTLDSLRNQTLKELEIIVVNDGSTDNTEQVLMTYQAQYPDCNLNVYSKQNEGIAECRNYALTKVNGEYIGFLDSDDYAETKMFEKLYQCAIDNNAQVVVSDFYWENSKGTTLQKEGPYEIGTDMMVHLFATLWNKLYQTSFIQSLDFKFPYGDRYEDACYLYCMVPHVERLAFTNEAYVHYVQHETSITHTNNNLVKNMIDVFQIILKYYKEHHFYDAYKDALEYIHIKFFLGNSFLRSARIQDKEDREKTIQMGWDLLNKEFPNWHQNPYLKSLGGMKNKYFSLVRDWNIKLFAWFFRHFKSDNL